MAQQTTRKPNQRNRNNNRPKNRGPKRLRNNVGEALVLAEAKKRKNAAAAMRRIAQAPR